MSPFTPVPKVLPNELWSHLNHNLYIRDNMIELNSLSAPSAKRIIDQQILTREADDILFSDVPQTFQTLLLSIIARTSFPSIGSAVTLEFNGGGGYYDAVYSTALDGVVSVGVEWQQPVTWVGTVSGNNDAANTAGTIEVLIPLYTDTSKLKAFHSTSEHISATQKFLSYTSNFWRSTAKIQSLKISSKAFIVGSEFTLIGIFDGGVVI